MKWNSVIDLAYEQYQRQICRYDFTIFCKLLYTELRISEFYKTKVQFKEEN